MSTSSSTSYETSRARATWLSCLSSAIRTCIACTIVGLLTLYGPAILRHHISLPAFSYVTVILIITDATLGDTVRGCWFALYATVQSIGPAILSLWIIGPANLTTGTTAFSVALAAFVVALPESTHLISKRIALGQIVLVYLIALKNGDHTDAVMHPVHLAVSTAVGAVACVMALLIPYPRLACIQVKQKSKLYADNASERLKLFVKIFFETNKSSVMSSLSQAKSLAAQGNKLLNCIMRMQESMQWERFPLKFLKSHYITPGFKFKDLEVILKGLELASINAPFSANMLKPEFKSGIEEQLNLKLKQVQNCLATSDSMTVPESDTGAVLESLQTLHIQTIEPSHDNLPSLFVLFCFTLLCKDSVHKNTPIQDALPDKFEGSKKAKLLRDVWCNLCMGLKKQRMTAALKCSLSLGLAVFLGTVYIKDDGIWSGLPVAISLASAREATFVVANIKAQGTVLGSVYGVLICFIFGSFSQLRLLSLFPWFVFTSFLRRSKLYGQAGGISAIIGAVLILGRTNFGLPKDFAVARIVETFIGLSCSVMVDLIFQPTRASPLAKVELSRCLAMLRSRIGSLSIQGRKSSLEFGNGDGVRLNIQVNQLRKVILEAEMEPSFWFLPFHRACYNKVLKSISTTVDLLFYMSQAIRFLEVKSKKLEASSWKKVSDKLENNLKVFSDTVSSLFKCFEEISSMKSVALLEKQFEENGEAAHDLEMGKLHNLKKLIMSSASDGNEIFKKIEQCYIEDMKESCGSKFIGDEEEEEVLFKSQLMLCLGAIGFCINGLLKETKEIEKGIKELVEWENPYTTVNLYEISCKLTALQN